MKPLLDKKLITDFKLPPTQETILITGCCGFVGSLLTQELLLQGFKVRGLDNLSSGKFPLLHLIANKNFEFIKGDIRNPDDIKCALWGTDMVLHLAAIVGVSQCRKDEKLAKETNVEGTKLLNKLRANIPLIYASTISVYGLSQGECDENSATHTAETYGETKLMGEKEILNGENFVILRFATGFGFSLQSRSGYMIINDFVKEAIETGQLILFDKDFKRSFIHVREMVDAYLFTIKNFEKMKNQCWNVGCEKFNFSKGEIALKIKKEHPFSLFFKEGERTNNRDYYILFKKINNLGFIPKITVEEGIQELIRGYKL